MAQSFLGLSSDALKKYRSLIISLIFLVLLAVASILASLFLSSQYNKAFGRYSAMSTAIDLHHDYIIALQAAEDEDSPIESRVQAAQIASQTYEQLKNFYPAFLNGGEANYGYGKLEKSMSIPAPLDADDRKRIEDLYTKAKGLIIDTDTKLNDALKTADAQKLQSDAEFNAAISEATHKEVANWEKGFVLFNGIRTDYQNRANTYDQINKYLTLGSIAALLLYLGAVGLNNLRRLVKSDEEIEQARRETDDIMKNVNTGLFLLDKDLKIGNQYSAELEKILGSKEIAGQNLTKLLTNKVSAKDLETTSEFVEQLYNALVREKLLGDLNPLQRIMVMDDKQQSHYLDFKFSRIYHQKNIEKVLVSVQDITPQVKLEQRLEQEREQNNLQVDMLTTILNVSPALIDEFIDNTKQNITKINNILKQEGASQTDLTNKLNAMYRIMHSLKGEASVLKLHNFVKIATNFEEKLKGLQGQSTLSGNEFLPLTIYLDEMLHLANTIDALGKRIAENVSHREAKMPLVSDEVAPVANETFLINEQAAPKVSSKAEFYQQLVKNIATRQGKKVTLTTPNIDAIQLPKAIDSVLKEIMVQLLRNAMVHGIETPAVRLQNGKSETGSINMILNEQPTDYTLIVEDDGQGLNYNSIRERALAMGYNKDEIMQWNENQLITLLFKQGFSTYQTDDEDAGRGMGMDIIKEHIQELHGKISINTKVGQFTHFTIKIPKTSIQ